MLDEPTMLLSLEAVRLARERPWFDAVRTLRIETGAPRPAPS